MSATGRYPKLMTIGRDGSLGKVLYRDLGISHNLRPAGGRPRRRLGV